MNSKHKVAGGGTGTGESFPSPQNKDLSGARPGIPPAETAMLATYKRRPRLDVKPPIIMPPELVHVPVCEASNCGTQKNPKAAMTPQMSGGHLYINSILFSQLNTS